jgi:hypothetical protein
MVVVLQRSAMFLRANQGAVARRPLGIGFSWRSVLMGIVDLTNNDIITLKGKWVKDAPDTALDDGEIFFQRLAIILTFSLVRIYYGLERSLVAFSHTLHWGGRSRVSTLG